MPAHVRLDDITIRTDLRSGDIGWVVSRHGVLYKQEYEYGIEFESYVAAGLHEFAMQYDPRRSRVWVCEHNGKTVGFILLMDRGEAAQLRYFLIEPEYRAIGLGKRLMELFVEFLRECGYKSSYLWTTKDLDAAASLYTRHGFVLTKEEETSEYGRPATKQKYVLTLG